MTILSSRMDLIDRIIGHRDWVHASIELAALAVVGGAGVARMSPLSISPEGRKHEMRKKMRSAKTADVAAGVAAGAAEKAAKAATVAVEAATVASVESAKAADTVDE